MLAQIYLHRWFKVCIRVAEKQRHIPFGSKCCETVTSTCWWTLLWRFRDLAKRHSVPSAVLAPNFSNGLFFWEHQSLQKEAEFLFLLAWRKNIGIGDCFETALFSWLMPLVWILCTYGINKRSVSVTGLQSEEEVLREEPVGCCSWWWLGEIRCRTMSALARMGKLCFLKGLKVISLGKNISLRGGDLKACDRCVSFECLIV